MASKLSRAFMDHLSRVYDADAGHTIARTLADDVTSATLYRLSNQFVAMRKQAESDVRAALAALDKDDPLFCPISLYRPMSLGLREIAHTSTLAWLLNPQGDHGLKGVLTDSFLKLALPDCDPSSFKHVRAEAEHPIKRRGRLNNRQGRIDVWITCERQQEPFLLIVEAKIEANEDESQLRMYEAALREQYGDDNMRCVFLTRRNNPRIGRADNRWQRVSWSEVASAFRAQLPTLVGTAGYQYLRLYLAGVLQDILGWPCVPRSASNGGDLPAGVSPYDILRYLREQDIDTRSEGVCKCR